MTAVWYQNDEGIHLFVETEFKYFEDYFSCLVHGAESVVFPDRSKKVHVWGPNALRFVDDATDFVFVNTEQLSRKVDFIEVNRKKLEGHTIWDFSAYNVSRWQANGFSAEHRKYVTPDEERERLRGLIRDTIKNFDFAFCGAMSSRREFVVKKFQSLGFTVNIITGTFGRARDLEIARCRKLLNIHFEDDYKVFESLRCQRWMDAGMEVVSEVSYDLDCSDTAPLIYDTEALRTSTQFRLPKLGLCMIVKDESHVILDALRSALPLIDTFSIVDTGSSDDTIAKIREFYRQKGIPGTIHERPWINFGANRTEALNLCEPLMDYCFMIDADDILELSEPMAAETVRYNLLHHQPNNAVLHMRLGTIEYTRPQIFKTGDNWHYVGVLHEYATNLKSDNRTIVCPKSVRVLPRTCGGRSLRNPGVLKYRRDAEVLLKGLEDEPTNERYMFYLGQSYRDAEMPEESIRWYTRRLEAGGWIEERFVSAYNITKQLKDTNEKKIFAWKAHELLPTRIESLYHYISEQRKSANWSQELYAMTLYASKIPKPETGLFLEPDPYDWGIWDELAIISWYTNHKDTAREAGQKLLRENKFPPHMRSRIETNLKLCG